MDYKSFTGISTALITPFYKGELDADSFLNLLKFQVKEGIKNFVLASTTGENPTLTNQEFEKICQSFQDFRSQNYPDLKMILATGSFSTKVTVNKTKKAKELGADAVLAVVPYYNKPPQKGLVRHFEKTALATPLPVILYNVPQRSAVSLSIESIKTLSKIDNIIGIKEASGDIAFMKKIKQELDPDFLLLSGDDSTCVEFFNQGGHGAISAGANLIAKELIELFQAQPEKRITLFEKYKSFFEELFRETNPIGIKQISHSEGLIRSQELKEPLVYCTNSKLNESFKKLNKSLYPKG